MVPYIRSLATPGQTLRHLPCRTNTNSQVRRGGVTLLELLVVLVLMGISAALVIPAMRLPTTNASLQSEMSGSVAGSATTIPGLLVTPDVDELLANARRVAIKRGEPLRLRLAADGVWAVIPAKGGAAIQDGRIAVPTSWLPDVTIDAMGTCLLAPAVVPRKGARSWDALACRWRGAPR